MKNRWVLALVLLSSVVLAACRPVMAQPATQGAAPAEHKRTAQEEANRAVAQRFYDEVFTDKNLGALPEIFDANLVVHDLDIGGEPADAALDTTLTAFPDVQSTIDLWIVDGDLVTAVVTNKGTHQAEYMGVPATGRPVTFHIIDVFRIKDGKVVDLWHNVPTEDILEQIQPE
ncbi:MAG: ester cyclase [Caldilineaceae bacterium]